MRKKIQQQYVMLRPSEKELSFMQSWEHIRENPKWKYLLIHGILKEGLFIFLFIKFIQFVYEKEAFTIFYSSFSGFIF
jgi:hypothetical protein